MNRSTLILGTSLLAFAASGASPARPLAPGPAPAPGISVPVPVPAVPDEEAVDRPTVARTAGLPRVVADGVEIARRAPAAFLAVFVAGMVAFAPGSAFTMAAGLAYGVWLGLAMSLVATVLAAVIQFLLARHFLRGPVRRRLRNHRRLEALDRAVAREGWKVVGLTRVSALIPGAVQNCLYALTSVRLRTFVLASLAGLIPPTLLVAAAGSTGGDLFALSATGAGMDVRHLGLRLVPLVLLAVAIGFLVRAARRELSRPEDDAPEP